MELKIHICSKLKEGAWGGGNQFLKALKSELIQKGLYVEKIAEAEAVIFNSYQDVFQLIRYWFKIGRGKIVYRLGPVFHLHRGWKWKVVDVFVVLVANIFADLIIFQSDWSYKQALSLGLNHKKRYSIICNAVDSNIFFSGEKRSSDKINLIYTSWSKNKNKGFSFLDFLDQSLDFNKFRLTFVGNSPAVFKNIEIISPLSSLELAKKLRESDIFISPAKHDACSNAILEALACGLPVVALDSGANSELVGQGGVLFNDEESLLTSIDVVSGNLSFYRSKIQARGITSVAQEYVVAIKNLYASIDVK